jgi:hypothetical protein
MVSFKIKVPERASAISSFGAVCIALLNGLYSDHLWSQKNVRATLPQLILFQYQISKVVSLL